MYIQPSASSIRVSKASEKRRLAEALLRAVRVVLSVVVLDEGVSYLTRGSDVGGGGPA